MKIYAKEFNFLLPSYWFGKVDSRPLSVFRILFAAQLIKVALYLLPLADEFYTDTGVTPRQQFWDMARPARFSLMDAMDEAWMARGFFWLWIVVLVCLLVGYRTRLMVILNYIIIASVHERNFIMLNGADIIMRNMSFWMIFIPLSEHYSLDALRRRWKLFRTTDNAADLRADPTPRPIFALFVRMLQIQIAIVYIFTFILKLPGDEWKDGTALFYTLQVQTLTLPTGDWVLAHVPLFFLKMGTFYALIMESGFAFFVFLPFFQPTLRTLGLLLGTLMHVMIALLMSIQDFSQVMIISYITFFIPAWVDYWGDELRAYRRQRQPLTMPIPGAYSPLWHVLAMTRSTDITLSPTADNLHAGRHTWVVMNTDGERYEGTAAWQQIAAHISGSRFWAWLLNFDLVQNMVWWLAKPRYKVVHPDLCENTSPTTTYPIFAWTGRAVFSVALVVLMGFVIWWNLTSVKKDNGEPVVPYVTDTPREIVQYLSIWQSWFMFAPFPTNDDGWISIPAKFENGLEIDLMTGKPVTDDLTKIHFGPDMRWKKYWSEVWRMSNGDPMLAAWGSHLCYFYNTEHALPEGERLASLEIHYKWRWSHAPNQPENPLQDNQLWRHWCYPQYQY